MKRLPSIPLVLAGLMGTLAWSGDLSDIDFHGFASQGYLKSTHNNLAFMDTYEGTAEFSEFALNASLDLNDKLRFGMQLFSRDFGPFDSDVVIDWAFGDYRWRDYLGVRLGKLKQPLGFYNAVRDADPTRSTVLLPITVYPDRNRDFTFSFQGLQLYGNIGQFDYEAYGGTVNFDETLPNLQNIFNLLGTAFNSLPWLGVSPGQEQLNQEFTNDYLYGGMIRWNTPLEGLSFGVSGVVGKARLLWDYPLETVPHVQWNMGLYDVYFYSSEYITGNWTFNAEMMVWNVPFEMVTPEVNHPIFGVRIPIETGLNLEGYYGQAAYRVNDWFEVAVHWGEYYQNRHDKDGENLPAGVPAYTQWHKEKTIGLRFDLSPSWLIKAEYRFIDGTIYAESALPGEIPAQDWDMWAFKTTFSF